MKYLIIALIFTCNSFAELKFQAPEIPAKEGELYNQIIELRNKNPQEALKKFSELPPDYSPAFDFLQAVIMIDLKLNKRAVTFLQKALTKMPAFYQARLTLAQLLLNSGDHKAALPELLEVVKLGRADGNIWKYISVCYLELMKYDTAELALNQARLFTPDDPSLDKALLNVYLKKEDYVKSEQLSKQMLNGNPDDKNLWVIYIQSLLANEKQKEALLNQELKIRLFGNNDEDLKLLADLYYNTGVFLKAAEVYLKVTGPLSGKSLLQAARCYSYSGDYKKIIFILRDPKSLRPPEKEQFYTLKAEAYHRRNMPEDALKNFLEALKYNSNNHYALFYTAEIYENLEKFTEALDYYSRSAKNKNYFISAKLRRARVYMNLDKNIQALAEVEEVLKVDSSESTKEFYTYLKETLK